MQTIDTDIVIFGGGVAGLWLLNRLRQAGYEALLLESDQLGGGESRYAQGIIHGGLKSALTGIFKPGSEAIAAMPDAWRDCLNGRGDVDLRGVRVLAEEQHLWSETSLASRLTTFVASRLVRSEVASLAPGDHPALLHDPRFAGWVYRVNDLVLDMPSLVAQLARPCRNRIYKVSLQNCHLEADDRHSTKAIFITAAGVEPIRIHAQRVILAAGRGNRELLDDLGCSEPTLQVRPLHMVLVKHALPYDFYGQCIGTSARPSLIITTHPTPDGERIWYIGGELANDGAERDERLQIEQTKQALRQHLPWLDLRSARYRGVRVEHVAPDRAFMSPDGAFAEAIGNNIIAWPTKLTLAPHLGRKVLALLDQQGIRPQAPALTEPLPLLSPEFARPVWESLFT